MFPKSTTFDTFSNARSLPSVDRPGYIGVEPEFSKKVENEGLPNEPPPVFPCTMYP
jgi:hypothetical protein